MVGLGGSAGSIEALQAFFERMPADTGMAFVVVMHLSPDHDSHLAEMLRSAPPRCRCCRSPRPSACRRTTST